MQKKNTCFNICYQCVAEIIAVKGSGGVNKIGNVEIARIVVVLSFTSGLPFHIAAMKEHVEYILSKTVE